MNNPERFVDTGKFLSAFADEILVACTGCGAPGVVHATWAPYRWDANFECGQCHLTVVETRTLGRRRLLKRPAALWPLRPPVGECLDRILRTSCRAAHPTESRVRTVRRPDADQRVNNSPASRSQVLRPSLRSSLEARYQYKARYGLGLQPQACAGAIGLCQRQASRSSGLKQQRHVFAIAQVDEAGQASRGDRQGVEQTRCHGQVP